MTGGKKVAAKRKKPATKKKVAAKKKVAPRKLAPGKKYDVRIYRHVLTPFTDENGAPKYPTPYLPVLKSCDICPARCCHYTVKVSLPDALDFCRTLGLPFFAGLTIAPSHLARAFSCDSDPRFAVPGVDWSGRAEITLIRRPDGSCSNLVEIGGYQRCSVYAARPSTCRLYPVAWTSEVAKGGPLVVSCPVAYAITPSVEQQMLRDIEWSIDRWAIHDKVLEEWHGPAFEDGRTVDRFLSFAIPRTAELMGVSAEGVLAAKSPEQRLYDAMVSSKVLRMPPTPGPSNPGTSG